MSGTTRRALLGGAGAALSGMPGAALPGLAATVLSGALGPAAAQQFAAGPAPAQARPYRILMLLTRGWEEACDGFRDYFQARGIRVDLMVRDAALDLRRVPGFIEEARTLRPDLVYTWGTGLTVAALGPWDAPDPRRHLTGIPAVFNIVADPVGNRLVRSREAPGRPVTGTEYIVPVEVQTRVMTAFRGFRHLAAVFNPRESNSVVVLDALERHGAERGFTVARLPVPLDDGQPDARAIPTLVSRAKREGAEWLYIPPDTFLQEHRQVLTEIAVELGLPAFAATERFVTYAEALTGLVSRYYNVGAFTAFKAEQILTGARRAQDIPVEPLARFSLLIRMATAQRLSVFPPVGLLRLAETV